METTYQLEKLIWTDNDYDQMGWHDSRVYAIAFDDKEFRFMLDIDYIFQWIHPLEGETYFKFWVAPVTLIFENIWDLKINIDSNGGLEIDDIHRSNPNLPKNADFVNNRTEYDWIIETQQGEITFKSIGFKQYTKQKPILLSSQEIELEKRGGISFSTKTF
jgi:hypothetical protein